MYHALMKESSSMSVGLTPEARMLLSAIQKRTGIAQKQMVRQLLDWLVHADEVVQGIALGQYSQENMPSIAKIVAAREEGKPAAVVAVEHAAQQKRKTQKRRKFA